MPPKQTRATRAAASKSADSETPALTAETAPPASASASASAPAPAPTPAPPAAKPTTTETPLFLPNSAVSSDDDEPTSPIVRKKAPAPPRLTHIQSDSSGSSGDDEDDDYESDDDPVVREYDVFMTSELAQHLHLFQYPVRSRAKPYTSAASSCPVDARFKPKAGLVEVDVPVNIAVNFDKEKGKVWGDVLRKSQQAKESGLAGKAMGAGRTGKRRKVKDEDSDEEEEQDIMFVDFEEAVKKGRVLSKQTLGSKIQADEAKYMVGVFRNDQLHLTPVKATLQLRPQFPHVDAQSAAERAQSKSLRDADEPEKPTQARAVHMTVSQEVSQMSSTMKALRIAEEEEWMKMHWVDQDDDSAWDQYELLCLKDPETAERLKCGTQKSEYMDWLSGAMMRKKEVGK